MELSIVTFVHRFCEHLMFEFQLVDNCNSPIVLGFGFCYVTALLSHSPPFMMPDGSHDTRDPWSVEPPSAHQHIVPTPLCFVFLLLGLFSVHQFVFVGLRRLVEKKTQETCAEK